MKKSKAKRLRTAGWKVGSAQEFLGLTDEEAGLIELKLAVADFLAGERRRQHLTQTELAERIGSSQSRVAKIEAGDASVSLDLMLRAAFSLGASLPEVARSIGRPGRPRARRKAG